MRGVETVTNNNEAVQYWRIMRPPTASAARPATFPDPTPYRHTGSTAATMEPAEIAELRTMYVFTPQEGRSWGLTFEDLGAKLRERDPDEFLRIEAGGPIRGSSMHFGITLGDEQMEGLARLSSEGVAVLDCNAHLAAEFALWLRERVVPTSMTVMFNTAWGLEDDMPPTPVPDAPRPDIVAALVAHIEETGGLD